MDGGRRHWCCCWASCWYRIYSSLPMLRNKLFSLYFLFYTFYPIDAHRYSEFQFFDYSAPMSRSGVSCVCPKPKSETSFSCWYFSFFCLLIIFPCKSICLFQITRRCMVAGTAIFKRHVVGRNFNIHWSLFYNNNIALCTRKNLNEIGMYIQW